MPPHGIKSSATKGDRAIAPYETNEKYLQDTHFIPLPAHIWALSYDQIREAAGSSRPDQSQDLEIVVRPSFLVS